MDRSSKKNMFDMDSNMCLLICLFEIKFRHLGVGVGVGWELRHFTCHQWHASDAKIFLPIGFLKDPCPLNGLNGWTHGWTAHLTYCGQILSQSLHNIHVEKIWIITNRIMIHKSLYGPTYQHFLLVPITIKHPGTQLIYILLPEEYLVIPMCPTFQTATVVSAQHSCS